MHHRSTGLRPLVMEREAFEAVKDIRRVNRALVTAIHELKDRLKKVEEWVKGQNWESLDVYINLSDEL